MTTDELKKNRQMKQPIELGRIAVTRGALGSVPANELLAALARHCTQDWGDIEADDWQANDEALEHQGRIMSRYDTPCGVTLWIITEWDRETTTILLPQEY